MQKEQRPAVADWFTTADGAIRLQGTRCNECGTPYFPRNTLACRNPYCAAPKDGSELAEYLFSTRGRIWSYADARYKPPAPYVSAEPFQPYVVAAVQFEVEQMVILGQVVPGFTVDDLAVDMPVELALGTLYTDEEAEHTVWMWRPVND
ncbi:Zn-ribbon domain-containing OB-fold protein [Nocardia goodfellowii]|uniref:OB-fold protein n=1 Tax=Nocardia goodfellowii TaxID=882446 RepID=A0ABS4QFQ3_9NOCA|nr:putative OB-fold protein [Nocardia goodfellowii]